MNIFTLHTNGRHVISYIFVIISFLVGMYQLKGLPYHIRGVICMLMCSLATNFYEAIWSAMSVSTGVTIVNPGLIYLYIMIVIGLGAIMSIVNDQFKFIKIGKVFLMCMCFYVISFLALYASGWFYDVGAFMLYKGPDPHNWLWAVSKGLGFFVWNGVLAPQTTEKNDGVGQEEVN